MSSHPLKSMSEIYKDFYLHPIEDFMVQTAEYVNTLCKENNCPEIFSVNSEDEFIEDLSGANYIRCFSTRFNELDNDRNYYSFNENNALDFINLIEEISRKNNFLLRKDPKEDLDYFIDDGYELTVTKTPEEFLDNEYTTRLGCRPAYYVDHNAVFSYDRFSGNLSLFKIFPDAEEANLFIIEYMEDRQTISFGTSNVDKMIEYYQDMIYDISGDDMDEDDIDAVNHYKEELKKLEEYQLNIHKTIDCEITDNVNRENSGRGI